MKSVPLSYYPTTWVLVDDDQIILNMISHLCEEYNPIKAFQSPKICMAFLNGYQSPLKEKNFLRSITDDETYGTLQHSLTDFDITMLARLADEKTRHDEITALVIDYNMPEIDGLSLAKACDHLPMQKILLTGGAQEKEAIEGFNKNLIQRFIQKSEVGMGDKLISYLQELTNEYFNKLSAPILSLLETETKLPLSDPIFIEFFESFCKKEKVSEYYLMDKQGSFLCLDQHNKKFGLVLHSDISLDEWQNTYGSELAEPELAEITTRKKIPFFGIGKETWHVNSNEWVNHLYTVNTLDGRERYYWAKINL